MSQSSGYCGRLTCRTEWTRARWENAASLVAWSESWLGSLGVKGRLAVPSLKRSSTWWASRVVPHNHCRLDGSPEMGSSSDAARRLALKLQAIYNYPLFLFFPRGRYLQSRDLGMGVRAAAAGLPPYMCGSWVTSCPLLSGACWDHAVFEPLLWSWADRHRGVRLVCQPVGEIPLPFQTWILIYPGNYNQPATSCDGVAPAIYEFLFTVILLLAVNFEHLQRGITSTWSKLQVTPTGHALLALLLNFGMGTAIVFLTTIEVPYTVSLWTKVLFNQHLKHSSAFWLFGEWLNFLKVFFNGDVEGKG